MKKLIVTATGLLIVAVSLILLIGASLPAEHSVSVSRTVPAKIETVWQRIFDFPAYGTWRRGLGNVEVVSANEWIETDSSGDRIPFRIEVIEEFRKAKIEIASDELEFGGYWLIDVTPNGSGTNVTITENGVVHNVVFRFASKYVFGHDASINAYLRDLSELS